MIRHVLLGKFRTSASEEQRQDIINELHALRHSIPEIREWSVGKQALPSNTAYDFALVSGFENIEALERYRNHPDHIRIKNLLIETADMAVVDYEYLEQNG